MEDDYIIVKDSITDKGQQVSKTKECIGSMLVNRYSGTNTDCFILTKWNDKKLKLSITKINGIYYLMINGEHMADYRKFTNIDSISQIGEDVLLKNPYLGDITIRDCDTDIVKKGLEIVERFMGKKSWWVYDVLYYVLH